MLMLQPDMALLDETDSGLDIDALRIAAEGINAVAEETVASSLPTINDFWIWSSPMSFTFLSTVKSLKVVARNLRSAT